MALTASIAWMAAAAGQPAAAASPPPPAAQHEDADEGRYALGAPVFDDGYQIPQFDLRALPSYKPAVGVTGTVRIAGTPLDGLIGSWNNEIKDFQKRMRFTTYLTNTSQALAALTTGQADIGVMGHAAWRDSRIAFRQAYGYDPLEIRFAKGSFDDPDGSTPAIAFFVNKENPLRSISIDQIDGIFGAERTGGWDGLTWTTAVARGPEKDIRTWGQMGLDGDWANRPIDLYGTDVTLSNWADLIEKLAFRGGTKWNPALHEGPRADTLRGNHDKQIVAGVARDPNAIGFMFQRVINATKADVRTLPVIGRDGRAVMPSNQTVFDGSYPFHNSVYLYFNRKPGQPLGAAETEYARFVLSRQGQQIVARDRRFIPLNASEIAAELKKLEGTAP